MWVIVGARIVLDYRLGAKETDEETGAAVVIPDCPAPFEIEVAAAAFEGIFAEDAKG